jgi:DnaJ-class molecular chaperone
MKKIRIQICSECGSKKLKYRKTNEVWSAMGHSWTPDKKRKTCTNCGVTSLVTTLQFDEIEVPDETRLCPECSGNELRETNTRTSDGIYLWSCSFCGHSGYLSEFPKVKSD